MWEVKDAGDAVAQDYLAAELSRIDPTTPSCRRRPPRTIADSGPTGCGSSTRSTEPASSASPGGSTGRCTSRCGANDEFGAAAVEPAGDRADVRHRSGARPAAADSRPAAPDHLADPGPVRRRAGRRGSRLRRGAPRLGRRQGDGGADGRGRHLRARRRDVPVGLGGARGGGAWPPGCTPAGSTARRSSTTNATPGSPTSSCAARAGRSRAQGDLGLTRGAERRPRRVRRPGRDRLAASAPPAQRLDRHDARRVPIGDGRSRDTARSARRRRDRNPAGVLRRRRLAGACRARRQGRLRHRSARRARPPGRRRPARRRLRVAARLSGCRSSPRSTARAPESGWRWRCSATCGSSPPTPSSPPPHPSSGCRPSTE